jgi:hypothetical protein
MTVFGDTYGVTVSGDTNEMTVSGDTDVVTCLSLSGDRVGGF